MDPLLSDAEFNALSDLVFRYTGIRMGERKRPLVAGRLAKRLRLLQLGSYGQYVEWLRNDESAEEREIFIDLITTHVTHFFREPEHFSFLASHLQSVNRFPIHVWSAAVSTGEEAYSIALVLQDRLGSSRWEILGTDVSADSVARAHTALFPTTGLDQIPDYYQKKFLLRGRDAMEGYFTFVKEIRSSVKVTTMNLMDFSGLPGGFVPDIVFLRNVMIYFDIREKQNVMDRVAAVMPSGSILMIGHSESLNGLTSPFRLIKTAIYERT